MYCTCNVTLRRVYAVVAVEKKQVLHFFENVFLALVIQQAMRMRHVVICDLLGSTIFFFHFISQPARFSEVKKSLNIHCLCKVHTPTNALFIKLDKVLKFTLKITLTCS